MYENYYEYNTQTPLGTIGIPIPTYCNIKRLIAFDFVAQEVVFEVEQGSWINTEFKYELKKYRVRFRDVKWGLEYRLQTIERALQHISLINQIIK